jgi:hypothetical protein
MAEGDEKRRIIRVLVAWAIWAAMLVLAAWSSLRF